MTLISFLIENPVLPSVIGLSIVAITQIFYFSV